MLRNRHIRTQLQLLRNEKPTNKTIRVHFLLSTFSQPFLDVRFVTAGVVVEVFERPGSWMPPDRLGALTRDLRQVAASVLGDGALDYGVLSGQPERLTASTITVVRDRDTQKAIAFNALVHMDLRPGRKPLEVVHLGLVMVDPTVRGSGLSWVLYGLTCVLLFLRAGLRPIHISNVTQVPAVVGMVSQTFSRVEPRPGLPQPRDFQKLLIAREIMAEHRHVFGVGPEAEFDETRFVIKNAYTGGSDDLKKTFESAPKHRDPVFNTWCETSLDYARGDDFLQIGVLDLASAQRYVLRSVPPRSLAGVALLGLIAILQGAVAPVLQWFDEKRDFGWLRAR